MALTLDLLDRAAASADPRPLWDAAVVIMVPVDATCAEVLRRAAGAADPGPLAAAARVLVEEARARRDAAAG